MIIETERLILRPWADGDAPALFQYARDPEIGWNAGWPTHQSEEESLAVIRGVLGQDETYAVVLKETREPVGCAGILFSGCGNLPMGADEAELGYWIGRPYWGRGLIPEAAKVLLRRCFCDLGRTCVWCAHYEGNDRSRRVMEKSGFTYHHTEKGVPTLLGDRRTEHFFRLTADEWRGQQK